MSRLALRCMAFLCGIHEDRPSRARIAGALKRSERSVKRAVAELVEIGWITCPGGGHGRASKICVIKDPGHEMARDSQNREKWPVIAPKVARDSAHIRALVLKQEQHQEPRKPMGVEKNAEPPLELVNEFGRRSTNPAWYEWRDRELRIGRARNPAAYRAALERRA